MPAVAPSLLLVLLGVLQSASSFVPGRGVGGFVTSRRFGKVDPDVGNLQSAEEEDFSAFLQRVSQWPLVEGLDGETALKDGKDLPLSTPSSSRNPFMSPWTDLFDEVISSKDQDMPADSSRAGLDKEQLDVISSWGTFITTIQQSFGTETSSLTVVKQPDSSSSTASSNIANDIFQKASTRVESVLSAATTAASPDVFNSVIAQARNLLQFQDDLVAVATSAAQDKGLDSFEAAERARNTTDYVASLVSVADQVLRSGYVQKEEDAAIGNREERQEKADEILKYSSSTFSNSPLFENIASARAISYDEFGPAISTIAEMGWLSGGIYENEVERAHELGHSIVAQGISADIYWVSLNLRRRFPGSSSTAKDKLIVLAFLSSQMVTDSIENEADFENTTTFSMGKDIPVRTIVIRGFDASDERVDRELLFTEICNLQSQPFDEKYPELLVHQGLYGLAEAVYKDLQRYIDWSAPAQKVILTGHSVGGSLSILLTLMLARDRGGKLRAMIAFRVCILPPDELAPINSLLFSQVCA